VQEEPKNMGAWSYVQPRLRTALREDAGQRALPGGAREVRYVGRPSSAVTATASLAIHNQETKAILEAAMTPT
jgi:2-oxoglutarate dehydrogenase E1 component